MKSTEKVTEKARHFVYIKWEEKGWRRAEILCQLIKLYRLAHINKHVRHMCDEILLLKVAEKLLYYEWKFFFRIISIVESSNRDTKMEFEPSHNDFPYTLLSMSSSSDGVIDKMYYDTAEWQRQSFLSFLFVILCFPTFSHLRSFVDSSSSIHEIWQKLWKSQPTQKVK